MPTDSFDAPAPDQAPNAAALSLDVVSDVICPWCYVGQRRLMRALAINPELDVDLIWRPYQLAPEIPEGGVDRKTYLRQKFGESAGRGPMLDALREAGAGEGIAFAFEAIERTPNTRDAHRLIYWAGGAGVQNAVVARLFAAYFEEGRDIGDRAILSGIAGEAGMDAALVSDLLEGEADRDRIEHDVALAYRLGVSGVPSFIMNRKYMIQGAQDPDKLARAFAHVAAEARSA